MKIAGPFFVLLCINFGALALGSWLMNNGPETEWYAQLNKAPWTPPEWVFGVAWTTIMICFSLYLSFLFTKRSTAKLGILFVAQLVLNLSWNYIFFSQHNISLALLVIAALTVVIFYFLANFWSQLRLKSLLLVPYALWLCIATSLNYYVYMFN